MGFAEIPSQPQAVELLRRSLDRGRLAHSYLFAGPNLAELEAVARVLAKVVNCTCGSSPEPEYLPEDSCDACDSCRMIQGANHPDVTWLRPESKSRVITTDQVRDLLKLVHLKPLMARWKVCVIVAADRMNVQAANAFLKTLEEPPPRSILILLSTQPQRLLETVISRCLRLTFAGEAFPRPDAGAVEFLRRFAETAAASSKGLMGRYRLLGVLLRRLTEMREQIEHVLTERSPLQRYEDVEPGLRSKWEDELTAAVEAEYRRCRSDLLVGLEWWLRDVWLESLRIGISGPAFPELADFARTVAGRTTPEDAMQNIRVLEATNWLLGSNVQEALALEVGLLRLRF